MRHYTVVEDADAAETTMVCLDGEVHVVISMAGICMVEVPGTGLDMGDMGQGMIAMPEVVVVGMDMDLMGLLQPYRTMGLEDAEHTARDMGPVTTRDMVKAMEAETMEVMDQTADTPLTPTLDHEAVVEDAEIGYLL